MRLQRQALDRHALLVRLNLTRGRRDHTAGYNFDIFPSSPPGYIQGEAILGQANFDVDAVNAELQEVAAANREDSFHFDFNDTYGFGDWVEDMYAMHTKFGVREVIRKLDREKLLKFLEFRLNFLQEELNEAKEAHTALLNGTADPVGAADEIVDAMIDLCVVAIGTLDAYEVDSHKAWNRVLTANMAKEPGIKPERPNPLGLPDLIKPAGWTAPTHRDNIGTLSKLC